MNVEQNDTDEAGRGVGSGGPNSSLTALLANCAATNSSDVGALKLLPTCSASKPACSISFSSSVRRQPGGGSRALNESHGLIRLSAHAQL